MEDKKLNTIKDPVPLEQMERLAKIMNDSPTIAKLSKTEWAITALKPAVQWMIAEEACKIEKIDKATFADVLKGLALQIPVVCRVLTLALLNDKERIEKDYEKVYDTLMWDCEVTEWGTILYEVLNLINADCFFFITESTQMFKTMTLERRKTTKEQK